MHLIQSTQLLLLHSQFEVGSNARKKYSRRISNRLFEDNLFKKFAYPEILPSLILLCTILVELNICNDYAA